MRGISVNQFIVKRLGDAGIEALACARKLCLRHGVEHDYVGVDKNGRR